MLINKATIIHGEKVVLVPYEADHVPKYHSWMQSEELLQLTGSERLQLEEEYANQISWRVDEKKCTFIVLDKNLYLTSEHDEIASMVGDVNLFLNDDDDVRSAEVEIMIAEADARGKGFGKEAVLMMMKFGIENLKLQEFTAKIGFSNTKSLGLFGKLGFEEIRIDNLYNFGYSDYIYPISEEIHLKKAGGYSSRNVVMIALKMRNVSKSDVFQETSLKLPITQLLRNSLQKQTYELIKTSN